MHILYVHQYFATPKGRTGTRSFEFARRWVAAGHRVTMLTSTAQLTDADLQDCGRRGLVLRFDLDGIKVIALNVPYTQTMGFVRRVAAFLAFMIVATLQAMLVRRVDVVYATSTPLTVGIVALASRLVCRRPYVFEVRDVWPAVPIAMGVIRNRLVICLLDALERRIYHHAAAIVALSPGMERCVREKAPPTTPVVAVTNCSDIGLFQPTAQGDGPGGMAAWGGKVICIHVGTMGPANGLSVIVRAADHFRDDSGLHFVLVGEGNEKPKLRAQMESLGLTNLDILDGVPKEALPEMLAAADISLVTFANVGILEDNSANKFFDSLSAGLPIVLNYGGWQRDLLEACEAGLGCRQGDESAFFAHIARLRGDGALRQRMGINARRLAEERFDRDVLAAQALKTIEAAVEVQPH
ncbi:MAG: glycosyltransferase family 4 protein [Phycisphaerae bacterium]